MSDIIERIKALEDGECLLLSSYELKALAAELEQARECERMVQERLAIAIRTLEHYANDNNWLKDSIVPLAGDQRMRLYEDNGLHGFQKARGALTQIEILAATDARTEGN